MEPVYLCLYSPVRTSSSSPEILQTLSGPTSTGSANSQTSLSPENVHMSRVVRKPAIFICENKDADQLRGNGEADQRLCFRYRDSTIPLLPKFELSSL